MSEWQPIETAPDDKTVVLLTDGKMLGVDYVFRRDDGSMATCEACACLDGSNDWIDGGDAIYFYMTHWMPLPSPPVLR